MSKPIKLPSMVFWYPQGDVSNGGAPAIAYADDGRGGLKLCVHRPGRQTNEWMSGVRNLSDPLLEERPVLKKNNGAWESQEQYAKRMDDATAQAELNREQAAKEREAEFALRRAAVEAADKKKQPANA
jgi:hypothetical protein